jgi:hypothetical protein
MRWVPVAVACSDRRAMALVCAPVGEVPAVFMTIVTKLISAMRRYACMHQSITLWIHACKAELMH